MLWLRNKKISLFLAAVLMAAFSSVYAQSTPTSSPDEKAQLQQQLQDIEAQIQQYQQQLVEIGSQKNTLQNKINQLKKQEATLSLQIQATSLQVTDLSNQLDATQAAIDQNVLKSQQLKKQMAAVIRLTYEQDNYSLLEVLLSQSNLSDALSAIENSSRLSAALTSLLNQTAQNTKQLAEEKQKLSDEQEEANNLLSIQSLQQGQLFDAATQQYQLLKETKGRESDYQAVLKGTQQQAAAIRSRLYELLGVGTQITFGQAVQIAQWASGQTGVRVAFLLAILTQESNLGKNVGTCNRPGDPPSKSWKAVMKPERDQQPFLQITSELGMDPNITPVSCPMHDSRGRQIGWGGAMGPAQFIPSTWLGYKDQVAVITGKAANPWDIRDAFLAAAIKLKAGGAGTQTGEWTAAMLYFSGSTNPKYRFYGDSVVATAAQYQTDIDNLNK
jgi:membrane-bound lytic murein transglycosylase B